MISKSWPRRAFLGAVPALFAVGCNRPRDHGASIQPANPLEELLVASVADPKVDKEFIPALMEATVYLQGKLVVAAADAVGKEQVTFLKIPSPEGQAMALYTSKARLAQALGAPGDYIGMSGQSAFDLGKGLPIALNFGLRPSILWSAAEAGAILEHYAVTAREQAGKRSRD